MAPPSPKRQLFADSLTLGFVKLGTGCPKKGIDLRKVFMILTGFIRYFGTELMSQILKASIPFQWGISTKLYFKSGEESRSLGMGE
jgi:hypothetical protein